MKYTLIGLLLFINLNAFSQKQNIDTGTFRNWPQVGSGSISDDGMFTSYTVNSRNATNETLVIQAVSSNWNKVFYHASSCSFSQDNKWAVFKIGRDTLCLELLGKDSNVFIPDVSDFRLCKFNNESWLTYRSLDRKDELIFRRIDSGDEIHFANVNNYLLSEIGRDILLVNATDSNDSHANSLELFFFNDRHIRKIWSGTSNKIVSYVFDNSGEQVAFIVEKNRGYQVEHELWYFRSAMDSAILLISDQSNVLRKGLCVSSRGLEFNKSGDIVFFGLDTLLPVQRDRDSKSIRMEIWSYRDPQLEPVQDEEAKYRKSYLASLNIAKNEVIRLEQNHEEVISQKGEWALIKYSLGNYSTFESSWNLSAQIAFYLVNLKTGERILLKEHLQNPSMHFELSPDGEWVVYYDFKKKNYYTYNTVTRNTKNITAMCSTNWNDEGSSYPEPTLRSMPVWISNNILLLCDNNDIWKVDPEGTKLPINLTNGYGRNHHIQFSLMYEASRNRNIMISDGSGIILKAVDMSTENWGFYRMNLNRREDPKLLSMGPYVYGWWNGHDGYNFPPVRSKKSNFYMVVRMSSVEAPNYFITTNFKDFKQISNIQPQHNYNWLTSALVKWKSLDGNYLSGILYKPENFDVKKKYPIIFDYYETRSDELNLFISPQAATARINIPWFVSNGYLVFAPDIHYKIGEPGKSAYNSIVSSATFLTKKPWVDGKRMGLQGHSFGGYETNFIITHSNMFAAACSASGPSDLISWFGSIARGSYPTYWTERSQGRIGTTPWNSPGLFVRNSPIFKVNAVNTPVLMMHSREDNIVPFAQAVEFFTALRHLGKRVWLIQYEGSGHSIYGEKEAEDFTLRMTQFFDHYLKGAPPPKWMTRGISSDSNLINSSLDIDTEIKTPGQGLNLAIP